MGPERVDRQSTFAAASGGSTTSRASAHPAAAIALADASVVNFQRTNTDLGWLDPSAVAEERSRAQTAALASIVIGDPIALVGLIVARMKESRIELQENDVLASRALAEAAETERKAAIKAAEEAAKKASSFLGVGGIFGKIAMVAGIVASVAAAVATGGAAVAVVGAAMVALAGPLTEGLVQAGVVPENIAQHFKAALMLTGGLMMGGNVAVVAGGTALGNYGDEAGRGLAEAGIVSDDVGMGIGAGLSLAGQASFALATAPQGSATSSTLVQIGAAAQATEGTAHLAESEMQIGAAVHQRENDVALANATLHQAAREEANAETDIQVDELKDAMQQAARLLRMLQAAAQARGEALSAAASMRA